MSGNVATGNSLAPERVRPLFAGRFGKPYLYRASCESTQRLLEPSLTEGAVAVCDVQTLGRGRLGRSWHAPAGKAILCSLLLRPPVSRNPAELSLVGGIATAEAVERATGSAAEIKWPNDVLLAGRKVAGVLAEIVGGAVILGVGLNVNQKPEELPPDARSAAGSLFAADGVLRDRAPLLADLLARLEACYDLWLAGGLEALHDRIAARDFLRWRRVVVDGEPGTAVGIDASGRLEVELTGGRRLIESGEVSVET